MAFPWPGEWTLERDEAKHKATVHCGAKLTPPIHGEKKTDYENLTYKSDDAHPEISSVLAKPRVFSCYRVASCVGAATVRDHRLEEFLLRVHPGIAERRPHHEAETWQETITRDHQ